MPLRLLEIVIPDQDRETAEAILKDVADADRWELVIAQGEVQIKVVVQAEEVEEIVDGFERQFSHVENFRLLILHVEAALPRATDTPPTPDTETPNGKKSKAPRISREELYEDIQEASGITRLYIAFIVLSTTVAAIGLLRDNTAAIIGAMVIAPLLGPNAALALAATLGDGALARRALASNLAGLVIAFLLAFLLGVIYPIDPLGPEIASRTEVSLFDVALALAGGVAGSLAFTRGAPAALVGVMVAVALLPPTVACGMLAGAQEWKAAWGAFLLLTINITSVNLAGVTTFVLLGIKPRTWWEAKKARTATRIAVILWLALLAILIALVVFAM
jgi:uncharacterized hydrophobic protein (TIGR00341 family)